MDITNPVIQTIIMGTQAEYAKKYTEACAFYQQAWELSKDAYEFCIAAHYIARCQKSAKERLHWNQIALDQANSILHDARIAPFLPSLYLNMGQSLAEMGNFEQSDVYFQKAAALGFPHLESKPGEF